MKLNVTPAAALCAAVAAFAVAGCGSSNDNSSSGSSSSSDTTTAAQAPPPSTSGSSGGSASGGGASSNLKLAADSSGQLKFDKTKLSAKAGSVTITMDNPSPVPHAVALEGSGVDKDGATVSTGGKSTVTVNLKPGTYQFYCPVDGHRAAGMEGTLTVK